jgi:hypothetical protein
MSTFKEHKTIADRAASDRLGIVKKLKKQLKKASKMLLLKKVLSVKAEKRK